MPRNPGSPGRRSGKARSNEGLTFSRDSDKAGCSPTLLLPSSEGTISFPPMASIHPRPDDITSQLVAGLVRSTNRASFDIL